MLYLMDSSTETCPDIDSKRILKLRFVCCVSKSRKWRINKVLLYNIILVILP